MRMMRQCQNAIRCMRRFLKTNRRHAAVDRIPQHPVLLHRKAMAVWQREYKAVAVESSHGSLR
jgi:hypothetical protein